MSRFARIVEDPEYDIDEDQEWDDEYVDPAEWDKAFPKPADYDPFETINS